MLKNFFSLNGTISQKFRTIINPKNPLRFQRRHYKDSLSQFDFGNYLNVLPVLVGLQIIHDVKLVVKTVRRVDPLMQLLPHVLLQDVPVRERLLAINANETIDFLLDDLQQIFNKN